MKWTPITRAKPQVLGLHAKQPERLEVRVELSRRPPPEWARFFSKPDAPELVMRLYAPVLMGSKISLMPMDAELEEFIRLIDKRISYANAKYEREVFPALEKAEKEEARRLEEARKKVAKL